MAVREAYTFDRVLASVREAYRAKSSFRRVAKEDYEGRVSHMVIARIVAGIEPKSPTIRAALSLPPLLDPNVVVMGTPVLCAKCGRPFVGRWGTRRKTCPVCRP